MLQGAHPQKLTDPPVVFPVVFVPKSAVTSCEAELSAAVAGLAAVAAADAAVLDPPSPNSDCKSEYPEFVLVCVALVPENNPLASCNCVAS